jgi:hypothetical protein
MAIRPAGKALRMFHSPILHAAGGTCSGLFYPLVGAARFEVLEVGKCGLRGTVFASNSGKKHVHCSDAIAYQM